MSSATSSISSAAAATSTGGSTGRDGMGAAWIVSGVGAGRTAAPLDDGRSRGGGARRRWREAGVEEHKATRDPTGPDGLPRVPRPPPPAARAVRCAPTASPRDSSSCATTSTCFRASSSRDAARSSSISMKRILLVRREMIGEHLHRLERGIELAGVIHPLEVFDEVPLRLEQHVLPGVDLCELVVRLDAPRVDPEDLAAERDRVVEETLLGVQVGPRARTSARRRPGRSPSCTGRRPGCRAKGRGVVPYPDSNSWMALR
jgi:hypothetical protein